MQKKAGISRLFLIGFVSVSSGEVSMSDVFTLATNVFGIGEGGEIEEQMFDLVQMFI